MKNVVTPFLAVFCFSLFSSFTDYKRPIYISQDSITEIGKAAFFPKEFHLNNGTIIKMSDLKGKIVLLDFWYRGCLPCLKATPELIKIQKEFKNEVVIIGINDVDDIEDVTDYLNFKKSNYFSTYKSGINIAKELNINVFPTIIILDQRKFIKGIEYGFDKKKIRKTIKDLIKEKP